ncbi:hypothetical protein AVEN_219630-1 [Araneus ventricosus]|uniref:Uncharacterized protein n=1 Tax=Araneus ventricosus TaxID=182803 RepID=A0A4Y2P743_ARAVE|nr:hypothetical protein AVEN_219630-1 [Araneus ventricosus]
MAFQTHSLSIFLHRAAEQFIGSRIRLGVIGIVWSTGFGKGLPLGFRTDFGGTHRVWSAGFRVACRWVPHRFLLVSLAGTAWLFLIRAHAQASASEHHRIVWKQLASPSLHFITVRRAVFSVYTFAA